MQEEMKMTKQEDENLVQVRQLYSIHYGTEIIFHSQIFPADIAFLMCGFDDFDNDQIF